MALSSIHSTLYESIAATWLADPNLQALIQDIEQDAPRHTHFTWQNNQLRRKDKLVVGSDLTLRNNIIQWLHGSAQGGHSGVKTTVKKVTSLFHWPELRSDVAEFIKLCPTCQKCKADLAAYPGLLQPLPIPELRGRRL